MTMQNSPVLGASASSAGDDFHELWALQRVLQLLDPQSDLRRLVVEGVPADDAHAHLGERAQAADVTEVRESEHGETSAYLQLKYSVANPDSPWTWARLFQRRTPKRPETSVLVKLANLYAAVDGPRQIRIITNQPLGKEVETDVPLCVTYLRGGGGEPPDILERLRQETQLADGELANFLEAFDLSGFGAASRLRLETDLLLTLGGMTDADARDDLRQLQSRISSLILPENRRQATVDRETLLAWLGAGTGAQLFPSPSNLTPPEHWVERNDTKSLVDRILAGTNKVIRLSAEGGCGKTAFMTKLDVYLPRQSEVLLFDCYGGGLFLSTDDRRHLPANAFAQVANELAGRLRSPFILQPSSAPSLTAAFKRRIETASHLLAARDPNAVLALVFDAADNSRTAANRFGEPCFIDELTGISGWPPNVRIILTCRPGRAESLGPDRVFQDLTLEAFTPSETEAYLNLVQPTWTQAVSRELHELTGGVARRLVYAVEDIGAGRPEDAISRLMPKAPGIDPLFKHRVQEAGRRLGDDDAVRRLLSALTLLPRPMPTWALAEVSELHEGDVQGLANDLGGLVETTAGWSFHDEDFEAFAGELTNDLASNTLRRACEVLSKRQSTEPYAALSLAEALLAARQTAALFDLAHSDPALSGLADEGERRALQMRRLVLALRAARHASDGRQAQSLLLTASKAIRTRRLLTKTVVGNLDLSTQFSAEEAFRQIAMKPLRRARRGELRLHLAIKAAATDPAVARDHLRWWRAWAEDVLEQKSRKVGEVTLHHVELEFEANRRLAGLAEAIDGLFRWKPKGRLVDVADALVDRALQAHRFEDVDDVLGRSRWPRKFVFHTVAKLLEYGRAVSQDALRVALEGLSQERKPSYSALGHGFDRLASERALVVLEAAREHTEVSRLALQVLQRRWPNTQLPLLEPGSWLSASGDIVARVVALHEQLTSTEIDLVELLPPQKTLEPLPRLKSKQNPSPEWIAIERANKAAREFNKARDQDLLRLRALVEYARMRLREPDAAVLDTVLDRRPPKSDPNDREPPSEIALAQLRARDLARGATGPAPVLSQWILTAVTPSEKLGRLRHLGLRTGAARFFVTELTAIQKELLEEPAAASTKVEVLLGCARLAGGVDVLLAQNYYNTALKVADEVDLEAVEYLVAAAGASNSKLLGTLDERRRVAERLSALSEGVFAALGDDVADYLPLEAVVTAAAAQHLPAALATVGRWRDGGFLDLDRGLTALTESVSIQLLPSPLKLVLLQLSGLTELPPRPTAEDIEAFSRNAVLSSWSTSLREKAEAIAACSPELLGGRWASGLLSGASGAPLSSPINESSEPAAKPIVLEADLVTRLDDLTTQKYVGDYELMELANALALPTLRVKLLEGLLTRFPDSSGLPRVLAEILPEWRAYPPVEDWMQKALPQYIPLTIRHMVGLDYREPTLLLELLGLIGDRDRRLELLLRAVEQHGEEIAPEILITLAGVIAQIAAPDQRIELVSHLLDHTEEAIGGAANVHMPAAAPDDLVESISRWLFALMADVDKRVRWRAAHAARHLLVHADDRFAETFLKLLARDTEPVFAKPDLLFYSQAARLWLSIVLSRVAQQAPVRLHGQADTVAHAALSEPAHVLIRSFLKSTALALEAHRPGTYSDDTVRRLTALNVTRVTTKDKEARRYPRRQSARREDSAVRYEFDDTDTRPYWFSPAAGVFGLDIQTFETMAERWICDSWAVPRNSWKWVDEPRRDRFQYLDSSMTSHRHGSEPTVERLSRYLEWHSMFCVMGELLASRPAVLSPYSDTFEEWLSEKSLTSPDYWLADLLGPPPAERRFWSLDSDWNSDGETWLGSINSDRFILELMSGNDFVLCASFGRDKARSERVSINSALVSTQTALSLASALEAVRDPMDFRIPDADDHDPIDEPGFKLEGWLIENQRDARLDESDPERRSVKGVPVFISEAVRSALGVEFDPDVRGWSSDGRYPQFSLDIWDRGDDEVGQFWGWRFRSTQAALRGLLTGSDMSLIVEVAVSRRLSGDYDPKRRRRDWRMFVIRPDLSVERPDPKLARVGRYWLRKLGMEPGADTLHRWFVHRIVELDAARHLADDTKRSLIEAEMGSLVLRLRADRFTRWN